METTNQNLAFYEKNCHIPVLIAEIADFILDKNTTTHQKFTKKIWQEDNKKLILAHNEQGEFEFQNLDQKLQNKLTNTQTKNSKTKKQRKITQKLAKNLANPESENLETQFLETQNLASKNKKMENEANLENEGLETWSQKKELKIFDGTLGGFGYFDFLANLGYKNGINLEYFGSDLDESVILKTSQKIEKWQKKNSDLTSAFSSDWEMIKNWENTTTEKNSKNFNLETSLGKTETEKVDLENKKLKACNQIENKKYFESHTNNEKDQTIRQNLNSSPNLNDSKNQQAGSTKEKLNSINVGSKYDRESLLENEKSQIKLENEKDEKGSLLENLTKNSLKLETKQSNFVDFIDDFEDRFFDAIILDLGFSGNQLAAGERGFSYQKLDELLDLRYDQNTKIPCWQKLSKIKISSELGNILYRFSGEKLSQKIAANIFTFVENLKVETRQKSPPITVEQLVDIISASIPVIFRRKNNQILSRVWQALRIWTNDELEVLEEFLPKAVSKLNLGGLLMIVSFHSLEDKIVTSFMRELSAPVSDEYGNKFQDFQLLTARAVVAGSLELSQNSQSRSAMLRVLRRIS